MNKTTVSVSFFFCIVFALIVFSITSLQREFFFDDRVVLVPAREIRSPEGVLEARLSLAYLARELDANAWAKCIATEKTLTEEDCIRLANLNTLLCIDFCNCSLPPDGFARIIGGNPRLHYMILENTEVSLVELNHVCTHSSLQAVLTSDEQLSRITRGSAVKCVPKFRKLDGFITSKNSRE